jgi:hypothetical protein
VQSKKKKEEDEEEEEEITTPQFTRKGFAIMVKEAGEYLCKGNQLPFLYVQLCSLSKFSSINFPVHAREVQSSVLPLRHKYFGQHVLLFIQRDKCVFVSWLLTSLASKVILFCIHCYAAMLQIYIEITRTSFQ